MTSNAARLIVVDDTDSQVQYIGQGWFQDAGSQDGFGIFGPTYNHTLHGTNSNGSFSFAFHGTTVHIYGSGNYRNLTGVLDPSCECFVDSISIGAAKPFFPGPGNNELMCEQKELTDGPHEITVNVTSKGQTFWFDYIQYTPSPGISLDTAVVLVDNTDPDIQYGPGWSGLPDIANVTNTTGSQMQTPLTLDHMFIIVTNISDAQAGGPVPHPGSTTTPSQSSAPAPPPPPDGGGFPVGAIIGGVIGGLALTALAIFIFAFLLRRYKRRKKDERRPPRGMAAVTPFVPSYAERFSTAGGRKANPGRQLQPWPSGSGSGKYGSTSTFSPGQGACQPWHHAQPLAPIHDHPSLLFVPGGDGQSSHGSASSGHGGGVGARAGTGAGHDEAASGSVHRRVVHQDSGVRLHQGPNPNVVVEDVPPDYTPD